ncbi:tetratricopeptide repeat-containing sulfotransferase family protein [Rhodanobacter sp. Col0626]|uniref:tetratricopeptide repeat-containing sulfotransferase family protein n=1 Tax=Rhodanobacter sp. Col0626 TaxID=3415679 RepID=UPI003CE91573
MVARLLTEGSTALSRGQADDAERVLSQVVAFAPDHPEANRLLGIACQMRGDYVRAVAFLRKALVNCPDSALFHTNLGSALYESGEVEAALAALHRACELAPGMAASWYNLGKALKMQFHFEDACEAFEHSLRIDPTHNRARNSLADAQTSLGAIPAAIANYREILRREPSNPSAWFALANLKTEPFSDSDVSQIQQLWGQQGAGADSRILLGFALAKALEDKDDYAGAFEVLRTANALKRREVSWNAGEERAQVEATIEAFAKPLPAPLDATLGHEVIFLVSLPRSGSSLTEQILASHPQIEGANEITDLPQIIDEESARRGQPFPEWVNLATAEDWSRLGREYMARTERWRQQRPRFTDKNLTNWRMVGAVLAMLPGARVVNCRRDALETCFAGYRQLFSNGAHFSYDMNDMADCYLDYDRLSRYWQRLFPEQFFDHVYESLLADPEPQIRRLLDFCGLEFDPSCLSFHKTRRTVRSTPSAAQVRQPLRSDTSRSARYGEKLDQLRMRLGYPGSGVEQ